MKKRYLFLGALAMAALFCLIAASPPVGVGIQHNRYTTNVTGAPVMGIASFNNISIHDGGGLVETLNITNGGIAVIDGATGNRIGGITALGAGQFVLSGVNFMHNFLSDGSVSMVSGNATWLVPGFGEGGGSDFFNLGSISTDLCVLHETGAIAATLGGVQMLSGGLIKMTAGAGTQTAMVGGTIFVNTTTTGNTGAAETAIYSNNIVANVLAVNGDRLYIEAGGTITASVNNKRIKVYYGATTVFDTGSVAIVAASSWHIQGTIIRTGAATQKAIFSFESSSSVLFGDATYSAPGETLNGSVGLLLTSQGGANNDVVSQVWLGEWKSAP